MSTYIEANITEDKSIKIEVFETVVSGKIKGRVTKASPLDISKKAQIAFDKILVTAKTLAEEFGSQFKLLENPPKEIELSFGVKVDASADVVVARAGSEAQFIIKVSWSQITNK